MTNFRIELFLSNIYSFVEKCIYIWRLIPPHRIKLGYSWPQSCWNWWYIFFFDFIYSVIVSICINNQIFVYFFSNSRFDLRSCYRYERKMIFFFFKNKLNHIRYDLRMVKINKSCWRHSDIMIRIGLLELDLMVIQPFWRDILASDINNYVSFLPISRISATNHLSVLIFFCKFSEHRDG